MICIPPYTSTKMNRTNVYMIYLCIFYTNYPALQQQAAATSIYAATAAELEGVTGLYFNNCFYCEESALARDKDIAHEVFAMSLKMIAERIGTDGIQKYLDKYSVKSTES